MSSSSSDSDSPLFQALSTDVVLLHIFQYVGVKDLLDCRRVNKQWHAVASEALYSRHLYVNPEKLFAETPEFDEGESYYYWKSLRFLTNRMSNNINFRFLGFNISLGGFDESNFRDFVRSSGKHVRRLKVSNNVGTDYLPQALANFTEVEHIQVGFVGRLTNPDVGFLRLKTKGSEIKFPKLRTLKVFNPHGNANDLRRCGTMQLCEELIRASPELKSIESFDVCLTEVALECGKLKTAVTHLELNSQHSSMSPDFISTHLSHLELFSQNSPPLKSLSLVGIYNWLHREDPGNNLSGQKQRLLASLNQILASSKDSLKYLRMDYQDKPHKFTKLTKLHIVEKYQQTHRVFPRDWKYPPAFYFPALKTVRLDVNCLGNSVKTFFGESLGDNTFPTVTTLEFRCPFDAAGIQVLGILFPNVKTLRVLWEWYSQPCLSDLWSFSPTLEALELIEVAVYYEKLLDEFEACITGFDSDTCGNLRKLPRTPYEPSYLDALRTKPSILKQKSLKRFSIHFVCYDPWVAVRDPSLSPIAHWYALDLMPELRTYFLYDFKGKYARNVANVLEPYKPYVSMLSLESRDW